MGKILIEATDDALRLTLRAILERAGHQVSLQHSDVAITDSIERGLALCHACPTLILVTAARADAAVAAMRKGVYGYVLLPLIPGEIEIMLQRALSDGRPPAIEEKLQPLAEMEMRHIREALHRCNNNQAKAARMLGIGRNTLWRKLKRSGSGEA